MLDRFAGPLANGRYHVLNMLLSSEDHGIDHDTKLSFVVQTYDAEWADRGN